MKWARLRRALDTWGDALSVLVLGLGAFLLYLRTLAPSVTGVYEDTLEFQVVCSELSIAHPTGYPLYTLLGKLFTFLPFGWGIISSLPPLKALRSSSPLNSSWRKTLRALISECGWLVTATFQSASS